MRSLVFSVTAVLATALSFNSCEDKNNGGSIVPDPKGTVAIRMYNEASDEFAEIVLNDEEVEGFTTLRIDAENNLYLHSTGIKSDDNKLLCDIGLMAGLGNIRRLVYSGWSDKFTIKAGHGFIVRVDTQSEDETPIARYARLYISYLMQDQDGVVNGAYVKYQYPFEPYK